MSNYDEFRAEAHREASVILKTAMKPEVAAKGKGVSYSKVRDEWEAYVYIKSKKRKLGWYKTEEAALAARRVAETNKEATLAQEREEAKQAKKARIHQWSMENLVEYRERHILKEKARIQAEIDALDEEPD